MARKSELLPVPAAQVAEGIAKALGPLNMNLESVNRERTHFTASTSVSAFSWGEKVSIQLEPRTEGTFVTVASEPILFTNLLAAPRAEENVANVLRAIRAALEGR